MTSLILRDTDIFKGAAKSKTVTYESRKAVKVIVYDTKHKIALVGKNFLLLPGGGVEKRESLYAAILRECHEEIGCAVTVLKRVGITEEYRAEIARHQITYFYTAKIYGRKGKPTTKQIDEKGSIIQWVSLADAVSLMDRQTKIVTHKNYNSCFNIRTHNFILKKMMEREK